MERQVLVKKVSWAASIYGKGIPIPRKTAETILGQNTEEVGFRWMDGGEGRFGT